MIYMDNAATTRLCDEAYEAMLPYLRDSFGNPGGLYDLGLEAKRAVGTAREEIAETINAHPSEVYFTGGGTEADNWAVRGAVELKLRDCGQISIITTSIEHHAVLNTCRWLEGKGHQLSYVNPTPSGHVTTTDIAAELEKYKTGTNPALLSVMSVNNELGTIQPVAEIGRLARGYDIPFHTDAVAAYGHVPIDVKAMNIDMMSVSAHKFGGPKGTGFLYVNGDIRLPALLNGGAQEQGRRGGTENVAGIAGMAAAALKAHRNMEEALKKRYKLDRYFLEMLKRYNADKSLENTSGSRNGCGRIWLNGYDGKGAPAITKSYGDRRIPGEYESGKTNGNMPAYEGSDPTARLPGLLSVTIPGINAEELIVRMGMEGICISAGAACASSDEGGSHVLKALGLDRSLVQSTVRISLNEDNSEEEIDELFRVLIMLLKTH